MSYILDALKRAEAERERERSAVPGLHTQPVPPGSTATRSTSPRNKPWIWIALGIAVVVLGQWAWHLLGREALPAPEQTGAMASGTVSAPPSAPASPALPSPLPAQQARAPVVLTPQPSPAITPAPLPPVPANTTSRTEGRPAAAQPSSGRTVINPPPAAAPSATTARPQTPPQPQAATSSPATTTDQRIYTQSELPETLRRELPKLAIGGSIYSEARANRLLIINGQLFHERDEPAPGLLLEQIKPKAAVLSYKGYRYEITY